MFILGHVGCGYAIARKVIQKRSLPPLGFIIGTLVPDLIDKTLYYSFVFFTGRVGADIGLISCTRTFGHSGILNVAFLALILLRFKGHPFFHYLLAVSIGSFTHLLLDMGHDLIVFPKDYAAWISFFFPAYEGRFAYGEIKNPLEHGLRLLKPVIFIPEAIGLYFLFQWRKSLKSKAVR